MALEHVGKTINGEAGIAGGLPADWFYDSNLYEEWDAPNSSWDSGKWNTGGVSMSETSTYARGTFSANSNTTGYIASNSSLPAGRQAYAIYGISADNGESGTATHDRTGGVYYKGSTYQTGNQDVATSTAGNFQCKILGLLVRQADGTYNLYANGQQVATGLSVSNFENFGVYVRLSQSGGNNQGCKIDKYWLRYTKT